MTRFFLIIILCIAFFNVSHTSVEVGKVEFHPPSKPFGIDYQPGIDYTHIDTDSHHSPSTLIPTSSIEIKANGTEGQLSTLALDGGLSSHTGIALNGTLITLPGMPNMDINLLPLELLRGVDIYKNNLSSYGISATGGLVDFKLNDTDSDGFSFNLGAGSFGKYKTSVLYSPELDNIQNPDFILGAAYSQASNDYSYLRDNGNTSSVENLDYYKFSIISGLVSENWKANLYFTQKHSGTGGFYSGNGRQMDSFLLSDWQITGNAVIWKGSYVFWNNQFHNDLIQTDSTQQNHSLRFSGATTMEAGNLSLNGKVTSLSSWVTGNTYPPKFDEQIDLTLDSSLELGTTQLGIALNQLYSIAQGYHIIPAVSATISLNQQFHIISRISRAFRLPSFNDLYWPNDGMSTGNPNLKNEDGIRIKTGLLYLNIPIYGSLTFGFSRINDLILWKPDETGLWMPNNIGIISGYLVNASLFYQWFFGRIFLSAHASFSYNRTVNDNPESNYYKKRIIYIPLYKTSVQVSVGEEDLWDFSASYRYVSERFTTELNTAWLEPYHLIDISASYRFVYGAVYNLLNQDYEEIEGYPLKGINFEIGVKMKI